jgi:predicted amidophosphoribosyltransferase
VKCCGQNIVTPFCPQCGRELVKSPLKGLLRHCLKNLEKEENRITSMERWALENSNTLKKFSRLRQEQRARKLEAKKRVAQKWKSWADAIEEAIAQAERHGKDGKEGVK